MNKWITVHNFRENCWDNLDEYHNDFRELFHTFYNEGFWGILNHYYDGTTRLYTTSSFREELKIIISEAINRYGPSMIDVILNLGEVTTNEDELLISVVDEGQIM